MAKAIGRVTLGIGLICILFLQLPTQRLYGQTQPGIGFPPFAPVQGSGFDGVNLQSLNWGFMVPVVSHPGRKLDFNYDLAYNSLVYRLAPSGSTSKWAFVDGWTTNGPIGTLQSQRESMVIGSCIAGGFGAYVYTDPTGTPHAFGVQNWHGTCSLSSFLTGYAQDASGYYIDISGNVVVRSPDGTKIDFTTTISEDSSGNLITQNPTITDPNGNQLTSKSCSPSNSTNPCVAETDWTDTLGQTALKITSQQNGPNGELSESDYSRLAVDGTYQTVAVKYEFATVQSSFGCSGITEFKSSNVGLVSEIDLPNGKKFTFTYEPTPGVTGAVTGRIQQVTLPTGGTISYQYTGANGGINCADGTAMGLTRTINDGTNMATWSYARDGSKGTTTVTAPQLPYDSAGNQTVISFTNNLETSRKIYQGTATGNPVQTVNSGWTNLNLNTTHTPTSQTVILEDGSTQMEVETSYDTNGLLQLIKEHDWGLGAPGPVLRTTKLFYLNTAAYTNLNIINRVTTRTVADSSGTTKFRTDVTYDDSGFVNSKCITGAAQHDDTNYGCAFTTRGLPTSVTTYTDAATPAGGVTKNSSYDSLGNLVTAQLNCCQQKQWNYSATTQYAFPDSVVSGGAGGPQLTTSATYYLTTGQVKTSNDENGQTTTYSYADAGHLDRLTDIQRPDNAHITRAYNDSQLTVTDSAPVQGASVMQTVTALDGLGRPLTSTIEDAANAVYSIAQTQYDLLGRPYKTSNPYTGSPQFWTTSQFDTLGRPTLVTLADGAQAKSAYSTNSVTATDPAGKQRRSVSNGIGQLIEVDQPGAASAGTASSGSLSISGTLQNKPATNGTPGTGSVTISGSEGSTDITPPCSADMGTCPPSHTVFDSGTVTITVNGFQATYNYYSTDTPTTIASGLASALNGSSSPVHASSSGGTVTITSNAVGTAANYSLSAGAATGDPTDFPGGSFTASASGASLTGGTNATPAVTDAGAVTLLVGSTSATVNYGNGPGQDSAASAVASDLASKLTAQNPPFTVSASGANLNINWKTVGSGGNVSVACSSSTTQSSNFSQASFTCPNVTLSGGADPYPPGIAHPYVATYSYGVLDNLLQVTQSAQTRIYVYDGMGRLTDATTPEAGHVNYQYSSFDLVTQRTDARGVVTTYGYDGLNRRKSISYNVGNTGVPATQGVTYQYGTDSTKNNNGRLLTVTDGIGSETFSYDLLGRITQMQRVNNGTTYTLGYAYNLAGELTQITYPSGRVVQQSFDAIGRLCEIAPQTSACATATTSFATGYNYNTAFQTTGFNYGNGVTATFGYSADRLQMTSLSYGKGTQTLFGLNYFYHQDSTNCPNGTAGNNGQLQCTVDTVDSGRNTAYTYDALARLATASTTGSPAYPAWGLSFSLDGYGNRTAQTVTAGSGFSVSTPVDPTTNRINIAPFSYDNNGNLTNDGNNTLVYDAENHVVSSTQSGTPSTYSYDGKSLRVVKSSGGTTTVYIFSGSKVIAEYENGAAASAPTREYIYSGSDLLAKIEGGTTNYYHADRLSTRLTTDANGGVAGQQGHYPFGEPWYDSNTTKWKFANYERDPESGNDYALFRFYANRLGRFSAPDPANGNTGNPQTLNRYSYAANDPINLADPTGMFITSFTRFLDPAGFGSNGFFGANISEFDLFAVPITATVNVDGFLKTGSTIDFFLAGLLGVFDNSPLVVEARRKATKILNGSNQCAQFFSNRNPLAAGSQPPISATDALNSANITRDADGPGVTREAGGGYSEPYAASTSGTGLGATIHLNPNGAFFNSKGPVTTATGVIPIGDAFKDLSFGEGFQGGGIEARVTILLHELAHILGVIPNDGYSSMKSGQNTQTILKNCQEAIEAAANSGK